MGAQGGKEFGIFQKERRDTLDLLQEYCWMSGGCMGKAVQKSHRWHFRPFEVVGEDQSWAASRCLATSATAKHERIDLAV